MKQPYKLQFSHLQSRLKRLLICFLDSYMTVYFCTLGRLGYHEILFIIESSSTQGSQRRNQQVETLISSHTRHVHTMLWDPVGTVWPVPQAQSKPKHEVDSGDEQMKLCHPDPHVPRGGGICSQWKLGPFLPEEGNGHWNKPSPSLVHKWTLKGNHVRAG
jgi:hypothetical protein